MITINLDLTALGWGLAVFAVILIYIITAPTLRRTVTGWHFWYTNIKGRRRKITIKKF